MERVTSGGYAPQFAHEVDMGGQMEEESRYYVLPRIAHRNLLQTTPAQFVTEHGRQTPHIAAIHNSGSQQLASLVNLTRDGRCSPVSPGSVLIHPGGHIHSGQATSTLSVQSSLMPDKYVLKSEAFKGRLIQPNPCEMQGPSTLTEPMMTTPETAKMQLVRGRSGQLSVSTEANESEEQLHRTQKKREKNRIAQQRFRMRQKQLVSDLQKELKKKSDEIEELKNQKNVLSEENKAMRTRLKEIGIDVNKVVKKPKTEEHHISGNRNQSEEGEGENEDSVAFSDKKDFYVEQHLSS